MKHNDDISCFNHRISKQQQKNETKFAFLFVNGKNQLQEFQDIIKHKDDYASDQS